MGGAKRVHWGTQFTWPCVAGCNMSLRHPVYMSASKVTLMEWPTWWDVAKAYTEAGQGSLIQKWRSTALSLRYGLIVIS